MMKRASPEILRVCFPLSLGNRTGILLSFEGRRVSWELGVSSLLARFALNQGAQTGIDPATDTHPVSPAPTPEGHLERKKDLLESLRRHLFYLLLEADQGHFCGAQRKKHA